MSRVTPALIVALVVSTPAVAQPKPDEPGTQSVSAGAQWALPYAERDAPPGIQVSWRRWWSPHAGIGADVRWWRHSSSTEINVPTQQGPEGIVIRAQQGRDNRRTSSYGFGVGLLSRVSSGRVSCIGGIGPGVFVDRTVHDTHINGSRDAGSMTLRSLGVQMAGEVEVRATRRISAFAGVRLELRDVRFVESGSGYPTAGVRLAF